MADEKPKVTQVPQAPVKGGVVQESDPKPPKAMQREGLSQANPKTQHVKDDGTALGAKSQVLHTDEVDYNELGVADMEKYTVTDQYGNRSQNKVIPLSPPGPEKVAVIDQVRRKDNLRPKEEGGPVNAIFEDEYGNRGYKEEVHSPTDASEDVPKNAVQPGHKGKVHIVQDGLHEEEPPESVVDKGTDADKSNFKKTLATK